MCVWGGEQVFRKGASQNWAREAGSELPEQQQARADEYDAAHAHERDHLHVSQTTGGEPMWGRRRGHQAWLDARLLL